MNDRIRIVIEFDNVGPDALSETELDAFVLSVNGATEGLPNATAVWGKSPIKVHTPVGDEVTYAEEISKRWPLEVQCPNCFAIAGQPCANNFDQQPMSFFHTARIRAGKEAHE